MKVLVIGGGGREHALCWKLSQSSRNPRLYCAPGNAGTSLIAQNVPIAENNIPALLDFARKERIDLTIVGPEEPLCAGIVDQFTAANLRIFGPTAEAARLEGDKSYAKKLMRDAGIPTAEARLFGPTSQELAQLKQAGRGWEEQQSASLRTGYDMARDYMISRDEGVVVKASGLAKGKGVFVHMDPAEALLTIERLMVKRELGDAGARIVVEELLIGREVSVMALVDGHNIYMMECAADHKRIGDNDTGANTGGMGAYSPSNRLSEEDIKLIQRDVFVPILDAMRRDEIEYKGILYAGLMLTAGGPKVLEFNCRLGDPEAQAILVRLQSDLLDAIDAVIDGRLDTIELAWDPRPALCVVMASAGYPGAYEKGKSIQGLNSVANVPDVYVFHAGTSVTPDGVKTNGGRVLGVTALGDTMHDARERAYAVVQKITFDGAQYRTDIGLR